jgi:hypothetical protein
MAEAVYVLCALSSLGCTALLLHGYRLRRTRLLLWSALCFAGLTINNLLLFADKVLFPTIDLSIWRSVAAIIAVSSLLFGLIWETKPEGTK